MKGRCLQWRHGLLFKKTLYFSFDVVYIFLKYIEVR